MHPNPKFRIENPEEMAAFVRDIGFGTLIVATREGLRAVHVPVLLDGDDRLRFHVARQNVVHSALEAGSDALFVANGPHAYVSASDYGLEGRVPTWSYVAVELNGPVRSLGREELVRLLDDMVADRERRLAPKPAWTRAELGPGTFESLLGSIQGFELEVRERRGTAKLDQHKPAEVRARIADALSSRGENEVAMLVRTPPPGLIGPKR